LGKRKKPVKELLVKKDITAQHQESLSFKDVRVRSLPAE